MIFSKGMRLSLFRAVMVHFSFFLDPATVTLGLGIGKAILGLFTKAKQRKEDRKMEKFKINALNLDRQYDWQVREDQRDKFIDTPQYTNAMFNANTQSMANIGNPVLAREDAYDPFALIQQQVAQNNLYGGWDNG